MTTITIEQTKDGIYKGVMTFGHAEFAKAGKDIVCASMSILLITSMNFIEEKLHVRVKQTENQATGFTHTEFLDELPSEAVAVLESMIYGLQMIQNQYGNKYLSLKFEEV